MSLTSITPYSKWLYGIETANNLRSRIDTATEARFNKSNTGFDTVSFSSDAMEKYRSMNGCGISKADTDEESSDSRNKINPLPSEKEKLLHFLNSDTFSKNAIGYAKNKTIAHKTGACPEDESPLCKKCLQEPCACNNKDGSPIKTIKGDGTDAEEMLAAIIDMNITDSQEELEELSHIQRQVKLIDKKAAKFRKEVLLSQMTPNNRQQDSGD